HRVGNRFDRFILSDNAQMQVLFQFHQLLAFSFLQSRDGNMGPARDNLGDVFFGYFFAKERFFCLCTFCRRVSQFLFQLRNASVLDFARLRQLTTALCALELRAEVIKFFFHFRCSSSTAFSFCHSALRAEDFSFNPANSFSSFFKRSLLAGSFSFLSAWRSISCCIISRSITSISVGIESSSIFKRDAASSTRSIALSGKNRSVM